MEDLTLKSDLKVLSKESPVESELTTSARLKELERRNEVAMQCGGAARIEKHKQGGRLTARERLDVLLDP